MPTNRNRSRDLLILMVMVILMVGIGLGMWLAGSDKKVSESEGKSWRKNTEEVFLSIEGIECIPDLSSYETGTLLDVIDGDSIRVAIDGEIFEVRYIGIDTPEYYSDQQQMAVAAKEENRKLVSNSPIYLFKDKSEIDQYDRLLRYVISNDAFINLKMVKNGFAQVKAYPPDTSCQMVFNQVIQNE